jgi:hypothetical protein
MRWIAGLGIVGLLLACAAPPSLAYETDEPWMTVKVHGIQLSDDDGSRLTPVDPEKVAEQVAYANVAYECAHIRFVMDPRRDITQLRSTVLNRMETTPDIDWQQLKSAAHEVCARYPGRLIILFRYGTGDEPVGGSFSWCDLMFVASCGSQGWGDRYWNLAHEIGHNFGLPHPHGGPEFKTVEEAEKYFIEHGKDPNVFEGDGFADTPPHPAIPSLYWSDDVNTVTLAGVEFTIPRGDITSYYFARDRSNNGPPLTPSQIRIVRWNLRLRSSAAMALPTNVGMPGALEAEALAVSSEHCTPTNQQMAGFGLGLWSGDAHLFVAGSRQGAHLVLEFTVPKAGLYRLSLGLTYAPDYGQVRALVDGKRVGNVFDAYGPMVTASGPVDFGSVELDKGKHRLKLEIVGKNQDATGYQAGLDCMSLTPLPWPTPTMSSSPSFTRPR